QEVRALRLGEGVEAVGQLDDAPDDPAARLDDAADGPAAGNRVEVQIADPDPASLPERQVVERGPGQAVPDVAAGEPLVAVARADVLVAAAAADLASGMDVVEELRPGVVAQVAEAAPVTLLELDVHRVVGRVPPVEPRVGLVADVG